MSTGSSEGDNGDLLVAGWGSPELALTLGGLMCVAGVGWVARRNVAVRRFEVAPAEQEALASASG